MSVSLGSPTGDGLRFDSATIGYGDKPVVRDVSLQVREGEFLGLVGPNGAGKSTLLRALTGAARLLGGNAFVHGIPLRELDARKRARLVGVVPQSPPSLFAFTALEFVEMGRHPHLGRLQGLDDRGTHVVAEAMELTDTLRLAEERVDTLSGGDLQRLTLAQALAQEPEVLLLDEPTSHLDLNHRLQVLDLTRDLAARGMTVLAVFHDLDLAARYSDRVAVVADGRVPITGKPAEVITAETVRDVFAVRAVVGSDPVTGAVSVSPVLRESTVASPAGPEVFVLGGSGTAAALMRRLALEGYRISAGALNDGDVDRAVAVSLGVPHVPLPPFGEIGPAEEAQVTEAAARAAVRVVCPVPFGRANVGNLRAVAAAEGPVVFITYAEEERDFTGGAAASLLEELANRSSARLVGDVEEALAQVRAATATEVER